ncbi:MAG TPA: AMP-binding protein [Nitrospira sp.]
MHDAPLIHSYHPDDVLAWEADGPRTAGRFLSDVFRLAEILPERPAVLNLLSSRYDFLVGFAATILRGQLTLLPQSRALDTLHDVASSYRDSYVLADADFASDALECLHIPDLSGSAGPSKPIPSISLQQVVALAFTSGSTGRPTPNRKTWGALVSVARATGSGLGLTAKVRQAVVATVPHQHMFGLEASVMLPIQHGSVMHAGRPLFPEDIRIALQEVSGVPLLVTTPLHLRACVAANTHFPPLSLVLSATAPLARELALEAERMFRAPVHEIFGFAEAGSVASRRTMEQSDWQPLEGVTILQHEGAWTVQAAYLSSPVPFPDRIAVNERGTFDVLGRTAEQVNIAGHRVSIGDLNARLLRIDGVQDGVFFLPDAEDDSVTRLIALVVAPGKSKEDILQDLRRQVDPVFLPRPLLLVPKLPRNETGKLPREALRKFVEQYRIDISDEA